MIHIPMFSIILLIELHLFGCLGLVHWEDSVGLDGEGGGREDWDGEHM